MKKLRLQVVSMGGILLDTEAVSVRLCGTDGSFGIMPGHVPAAAVLAPGKIVWNTGNAESSMELSGGVCEIREDTVMILAD